MDFVLTVGNVTVPFAALLALGCTVGLVAGMFGVGGGFLLIPLLHVVLGVPLPIAIGSGLCQSIATATGSLMRYRRMGFAEIRFDLLLIGGSMLGVIVGADVLARLGAMGSLPILGKELPVIRIIVTVCYFLLYCSIAALLWFKVPGDNHGPGPLARVRLPPFIDLPVAELHQVSAPLVSYIGLCIGFLSGLMGIGGGVVLIPVMLYGYGFDFRKCAGTGIFMLLVVACVGTIKKGLQGTVHLGLVTTLMVGSAILAQVGASLTRDLPAIYLRRGLAIVLLMANCAMLLKLLA